MSSRRMTSDAGPGGPAGPVYSAGENVEELAHDLQPLLVQGGGRWKLSESRKGLERLFVFKTFKKTWEFMDTIAKECAVQRHHPEWSNVYNRTHIRWSTHDPSGLSNKDVRMARFCDAKADDLGVVADMSNRDVSDGGIKKLTDHISEQSGDCCTPEKGPG
ncbi:MAG: hypothetical protein M1837_007255 [Sclerophora amabilis]|nr:MAG: hypothetical protein M1837_007255 [Sclerophora amabilis]